MYSRFFKLLKHAAYAVPLIGFSMMPKVHCESLFFENKSSIVIKIKKMLTELNLPIFSMEELKLELKGIPKARIDYIGKKIDFLALHNSALMAFNVCQFNNGCKIIKNEKVEHSNGIRYTLAYANEMNDITEIRIFGITKKEGMAVCLEVVKPTSKKYSQLDLFILAAVYYDAIKDGSESFAQLYSAEIKTK